MVNEIGKLENRKTGSQDSWKAGRLRKIILNSNIPVCHFSNFFKISGILIFSLLIASCSHMPDWLGGTKKDSGIKGTRISVLNLETTTSADSALAELKVLIPHSTPNEKWYKSTGIPEMVSSNPDLPHDLPIKYVVGIGGGATDGQHMTAAPIIAEGKIFVITASSKIRAFYAQNIQVPIWITQLKTDNKKEKFSSSAGMTYSDGKLYIATGYNEVDALDVKTGKVLWTRNINSIARSAPEVKDNVIYVNTIDNRLYAMDTADGGILWTHTGGAEDISMFGSASPVAYENLVIAPYSSGEMYALKTSDGSEVWSDVFARRSISSAGALSDIDASPVIKDGRVFVISSDGVLASSDIKTGKRMWEQPISGRQSPWIAGDFLYIITNKNELACIHAPSGGIKWVKQLLTYKNPDAKSNAIKWSGPVLAGDLLWIVSSNGKVMALSPRDGSIEYERKVPKNIYIAPVVAYGNIYLYTDDGELIQLTDEDAKRHQSTSKPKEVTEEKKPEVIAKPEVKSESIMHKAAIGTSNATHKMVNGVRGLLGVKNAE